MCGDPPRLASPTRVVPKVPASHLTLPSLSTQAKQPSPSLPPAHPRRPRPLARGRDQRASTLVSEAELKGGAVEQTVETAPTAGLPDPFCRRTKSRTRWINLPPFSLAAQTKHLCVMSWKGGSAALSLGSAKERADAREQVEAAGSATAGTCRVKESCAPGCDSGAEPSAAASSPVKAATPPELSECVRRDPEISPALFVLPSPFPCTHYTPLPLYP